MKIPKKVDGAWVDSEGNIRFYRTAASIKQEKLLLPPWAREAILFLKEEAKEEAENSPRNRIKTLLDIQ